VSRLRARTAQLRRRALRGQAGVRIKVSRSLYFAVRIALGTQRLYRRDLVELSGAEDHPDRVDCLRREQRSYAPGSGAIAPPAAGEGPDRRRFARGVARSTRRVERAAGLLRETNLPIAEIAFQTGWESLGTFGRTFRDVTGESPSAFRARERVAVHQLGPVPACILSAAQRPDLTMAVSEKRRQAGGDMDLSEEMEVP
jgi:hypothetical protein